jgi:dihydrofolate reductase
MRVRRLISYMFTSLDGFIADGDGELGWVPIDDELMGFANSVFEDAGGIVFGRNVYEGFESYWDHLDADDPSVTPLEVEFARIFGRMERIVASTTLPATTPNATVVADVLPTTIAALKDRPGGDLLLVCGPALRSTLAELGLVDRYRSLVAPVALGGGVPLFDPLGDPVRLRLVGSEVFEGGVVRLDHEPA